MPKKPPTHDNPNETWAETLARYKDVPWVIEQPITNLTHALSVTAFAQDILGFQPDPIQARLLDSYHQRVILNCTRQWGKSTTTAALAAHCLCFSPGRSLIVIVSPSERQSIELLLKIQHFANLAGFPSRSRRPTVLSLPNGSRVVGLPATESTIRCFSAPDLIILDEASRIPESVYLSVRPMLAAGGRLMLLSTPSGMRGFFYRTWLDESGIWKKITVKATDCPRFDPQFLAEERATHGDLWFRQEYLCEFLGVDEGTFPYELIQQALDDDENVPL